MNLIEGKGHAYVVATCRAADEIKASALTLAAARSLAKIHKFGLDAIFRIAGAGLKWSVWPHGVRFIGGVHLQ